MHTRFFSAQEEEVTLAPDSLNLLAKIGQETSLRYGSHLITTASLIAAKRKSSIVEVADVQRSYRLFFDQGRSVAFLHEYERKFIGNEGLAVLSGTGGGTGNDAMEIS